MVRTKVYDMRSPTPKPPTPNLSSPKVQKLLAKEQREIEAMNKALASSTSSDITPQPMRKIAGQKKGMAYKFTVPKKGPREEVEILPAKASRKRKAGSPQSEEDVERGSPVSAAKRRKRDEESGSVKKVGKEEAKTTEAEEDAALDAAEKAMEKRKGKVKANEKTKGGDGLKEKPGDAKAKARPQQNVKARPPHSIKASSGLTESEDEEEDEDEDD